MKSKFRYYEIVKVVSTKPSLRNIWGTEAWIDGKALNEAGEWSYGITLLNDTWDVQEDDLISIHPVSLENPNQSDITQIIQAEGKYQMDEYVKVISSKPDLACVFGEEGWISKKTQGQDGRWKYQVSLFGICWSVTETDIISTGRFEPKAQHILTSKMGVACRAEILEYEECTEGEHDTNQDEAYGLAFDNDFDEDYLSTLRVRSIKIKDRIIH